MKIKQCEVLKIVGHKITYSEYFMYGKNIGLEKEENTPKLTIPSCERVTDAFFLTVFLYFFYVTQIFYKIHILPL